jgi:dipeptidase D
MRALEQLEPKSVFYYFEELTRIPHGSRNTKAISDYVVRFARERGLRCRQDDANNVVIWAPGTAGYEASAPVLLQGHLDMVAEKDPDSDFDFTKDALRLRVDGDWLKAAGTTLGGDDGIAGAMMLAILDDPSIPHPPLECVFTTDEEIGMLGAAALDAEDLKGRRMLNLDSEDEGIFTVSCAGGACANISLPLASAPASGTAFAVTVSGLAGGHSGEEINKGRANANVLLGRVLRALGQKAAFRLVLCAGGSKDNAIPPLSKAVVVAAEADVSSVCRGMETVFRREYAAADPKIAVSCAPAASAGAALTEEATARVCDFLTLCPNGIYAMSREISGLVQTSCNLGILNADEKGLRAVVSVRSSIATQKDMLLEKLGALSSLLGGSMAVEGDYPAWEYRRESPVREEIVKTYRELFGKEPEIKAIHAGLECGLFAGKLPGLDAVSFGPDMKDIHTSREMLSIPSTQRVWKLLLGTLRRLR